MPQRVSAARSELKATQQRVLAALENDGTTKLTRGLYEEIAGVSRSQAAYDLAELVSAGILERVGGGRSTWYRLVRTERNGQRRWTNDRIRAALEQFCAGRDTWPSASEFKAAGHSDLYVAASRYGGISFWTTELGFSRPARTDAAPPEPAPTRGPRRRWSPRIGWAAAGVGFAAALIAAGGASFLAWHGTPAQRAASHQTIHALRTPDPFRFASVHIKQRVPVKKERVQRTTRRPAQSAQAELAVRTISEPVTRTVSSTSVVRTQPTRQPSGPVPLPSPIGTGSGPAPLPPPGG